MIYVIRSRLCFASNDSNEIPLALALVDPCDEMWPLVEGPCFGGGGSGGGLASGSVYVDVPKDLL